MKLPAALHGSVVFLLLGLVVASDGTRATTYAQATDARADVLGAFAFASGSRLANTDLAFFRIGALNDELRVVQKIEPGRRYRSYFRLKEWPTHTVRTDAQGAFELKAIEEGTYAVSLAIAMKDDTKLEFLEGTSGPVMFEVVPPKTQLGTLTLKGP